MADDSPDSHPAIYTIGHSNAPAEQIISLLQEHGITVLVDVRSIPASRHAPQFNRVSLRGTLADAGIDYIFAGHRLGGRPKDPQFYKSGVVPQGKANYLALVDYTKVAAHPGYQRAITNLIALARTRRTSIMCSEENPQTCHRLHLIAYSLLSRGIPVYHLRHHGPIEVSPFQPVTLYQSDTKREDDEGNEMILYTIGFTQKSAAQFFGLLAEHGVRRLIDVRLRPDGQLSGFAKRNDLAYFLPELIGCEYDHNELLAPTPEILKAYRESGDWNAYVQRFESLMDTRGVPFSLDRDSFEAQPCCLLCSEPTPEQCHRRLVAERITRIWAGTKLVHLV